MEPEKCGKCDQDGKVDGAPCECAYGVCRQRERINAFAEEALKQVRKAHDKVTAEEEAHYERLLLAAGIVVRSKPPPSLDVHDLPDPKK